MDEKQFWGVIDRAFERSHSGDDNIEKTLGQEFSAMTRNELVEFQYYLQMALEKSNTQSLLAACHVILDGCSSDSFTEFRGWLVSRGGHSFHSAMKNADYISELLPDDRDYLPLLDLDLILPTYYEREGLGSQDQLMDDVEEIISRFPYPNTPDASIDHNTNLQKLVPVLYKRYGSAN